MARKKQTAEEVEREVQKRLPHLSLVDHDRYEAKDLPARWLCSLHEREFQTSASSLVSAGGVGCPDCVEARRKEKRKARYADPDLERHLEIIRQERDETWAKIYRLRCAGMKARDIGAEVGIKEHSVINRLVRIAVILDRAERS